MTKPYWHVWPSRILGNMVEITMYHSNEPDVVWVRWFNPNSSDELKLADGGIVIKSPKNE